jgi:hypothetical protein
MISLIIKNSFVGLLQIIIFGYYSSISLSAQIAVQLDKMNAVFCGASNPVTVVVDDLPTTQIHVVASQGQLSSRGNGHYQWDICARDTNIAWLIVSDSLTAQPIDTQYFRVKRIPDLTIVRDIKNRGIATILKNFDLKTRCDMVSFKVTYTGKNQDPSPDITNNGARFNEKVSSVVNRLSPGDQITFFDFRYTCGCDPTLRRSDEVLAYKIK